ncbi:hypothetical protein PENSPDRAFT_678016 [Peniophora sp. CONT]|nr:hypothetical protein PENSPDRAFT_678016 [Peniophora sp. CONT]
MTEFWVSQKQYFCKYCEIFIRDDAPSRRQHESGLRHQGNKERYVRNIYKQGEKKKKDEAEEKREIARIEQAANAAYAADVGSGRAGPSNVPSSSTSPPPASKPARPVAAPSTGILSSHVKPSAQNKAPPKPTTRNYDNYTSAAELGIIDPDVQRRMEEAERRREEAFVGEWTVVEPTPSRAISAAPVEGDDIVKAEDGAEVKMEDGVEVGQKRPFPATADDDEDAGHRWKLRKKTAAVGLGELYDPGVMKLKPRVKSQPADTEAPNTIGSDAAGWTGASGENRPNATEAPKWTTMKWRKPGEGPESEAPADAQATSALPPIKQEPGPDTSAPLTGDATTAAAGNGAPAVKQEEIDTKPESDPAGAAAVAGHVPPASLFKKRKRPVRS